METATEAKGRRIEGTGVQLLVVRDGWSSQGSKVWPQATATSSGAAAGLLSMATRRNRARARLGIGGKRRGAHQEHAGEDGEVVGMLKVTNSGEDSAAAGGEEDEGDGVLEA